MLSEVRGGFGRVPFKPDHQYIVFMINCVSSCAVTLSYAGEQPDVTSVLAVYPFTAWMENVDAVIGCFQVPLTVLAAGADTYDNCCMIDKSPTAEVLGDHHSKKWQKRYLNPSIASLIAFYLARNNSSNSILSRGSMED